MQTSIYEPDSAALWLEWVKTYGVVVGITVGVAVVAACSYLQPGVKEKARQGRYFEARQSVHSEASHSQRSEETEESLMEGCGDLRRHLVQLDKKGKKKTEEKRFLGINLTDIQTDIVNRDDHEYRCVTPGSPGEQREDGAVASRELISRPKMPVGKTRDPRTGTPPIFNAERGATPLHYGDVHRFQHFTHQQDESTYSSESTFSKSSTVVNNGKGADSRFTKETSITAKENYTRRRRASSFRRMSSGDVVDDW